MKQRGEVGTADEQSAARQAALLADIWLPPPGFGESAPGWSTAALPDPSGEAACVQRPARCAALSPGGLSQPAPTGAGRRDLLLHTESGLQLRQLKPGGGSAGAVAAHPQNKAEAACVS